MSVAMYYIKKHQIITKMKYELNKLIFEGPGDQARPRPLVLFLETQQAM